MRTWEPGCDAVAPKEIGSSTMVGGDVRAVNPAQLGDPQALTGGAFAFADGSDVVVPVAGLTRRLPPSASPVR